MPYALTGTFAMRTPLVVAPIVALAVAAFTPTAPTSLLAPQSSDSGAEVHALFERRCAECHDRNNAKGGLTQILDLARLREARDSDGKPYVVPGSLSAGRVWERVGIDHDMPENLDGGLPKEEIAIVARWIEAGAPAPGAAVRTRVRVDEQALIEALESDVRSIKSDDDRRNVRYFTLTHLWNLGGRDAEQMPIYRDGLFKLLNSLSQAPRIYVPVTVEGTQGTAFRIDLRALGWNDNNWSLIEDRYPYFFAKKDLEAFWQIIGLFTKTDVPVIRGDWFAYEASRDPLYGLLLHHPANLAALERNLGVDLAKNLSDGTARRAGFLRSGVSDFNRLIERHAIRRYEGAYWRSYDFGGNDGKKNLRARPFGPRGVASFAGYRASDEEVFVPDGGEVIYNLPNGLQAYALADAAGELIPRAPISIVGDPARGEVENALSCMNCHSRGIRSDARRDEIFETASLSQNFDAAKLAALSKLHAGADELAGLYRSDAKRFERALAELKIAPSGVQDEPIARLVSRFQDFVRLEQAAEELGVTPALILAQFRAAADLRTVAADLRVAGLPRESFISVFRRVAEASGLGKLRMPQIEGEEPRTPSAPEQDSGRDTPDDAQTLDWAEIIELGPDPKVVTDATFLKRLKDTSLPWRVRDKLSQVEMLLVPAGSYERGASPDDSQANGNEHPIHQVTLSKPFYLGRFEVLEIEWAKVTKEVRNPSRIRGRFPVDNVSFEDVQQFLQGAKGLRLPTEAEWEYACRAGSVKSRYGEGDAIAWSNSNYLGTPQRAGAKAANALGFYDTLGNLFEFCSDFYAEDVYSQFVFGVADPDGPQSGFDHVLRGGSFAVDITNCRASSRFQSGNHSAVERGFRVARTP